MILQGRWEELVAFGDKLAGRTVRIIVLPNREEANEVVQKQKALTPEEWKAEARRVREHLARAWPAEVTVEDAMADERR